ncbi:hypothetical protein PV05_02409 [Exophiala xenobiotica]|uniref:Glutamine amidotransferase domain-containing protein n=1 Tax=Exophiala xenobiotica TaxID=348802 RepID=A0A0D2D692_9EURO|nr:uncharacterized protein PV05_02409 [Exophiala xenobiotica]KIW57852.1 hypothetical protein PV05_02409 [Exophiala xenobiotica]
MIAKNTSRRRVAIIRNYKLDGQWGQDMLDSFSKLILAAEPYAVVQHFQPIDGGPLPEASNYDLVILTGGTYDLTQPEVDIWVAALLDWIRNTVASSPQTKLLGICWGHQAIAHALGGKIAYREGGTLIDVVDIPLNQDGQAFFKDFKALRLHKFHKRIVIEPPPGFHYLADNYEISMSDSNQVMTFQGHPEMTAKIAQGIVNARDPSYLGDPSPEGIARLHNDLEKIEDGKKAFSKVMSWAFAGNTLVTS